MQSAHQIPHPRWGRPVNATLLETHARGTLFINVNYRIGTKSLTTPAVDWMTFGDSQRTLDRVLQDNITTFDPMRTALVFAILVSKTGNSIGMNYPLLTLYARTITNDSMSENNPADLLVHVEAESPPGTKSCLIPRQGPFVWSYNYPPTKSSLSCTTFDSLTTRSHTHKYWSSPTHIGQTHIQTLRTRTYVPESQLQSPTYEEQVPAKRNNTIKRPKWWKSNTDHGRFPTHTQRPHSTSRARYGIHSRRLSITHLWGRIPIVIVTPHNIKFKLRPTRDPSTLSGAPVSVEIVKVEQVTKQPRWKRLLGIGRAKDKK
ncbi:hypothetical protein FRB95_005253, partial [Tulasnella sp. JGI-2019a]